MGQRLISYLRPLIADPKGFAQKLQVPVLLWESASPSAEKAGDPGVTDGLTAEVSAPGEGETVVFELRKASGKKNPFAMGITVGRVDQNDVEVDHASVSRFHAYFQLGPKGWVLCDAESKNGTYLDGMRLTPNEKVPVPDGAPVRFGEIELTFLLPESFAEQLRKSWVGK